MTREEVFQRLQPVLGEVCGIAPVEVRWSARLSGFGLDSIRVLELMVRAEEEFGVQLDVEDMVGIKTIEQLVDYIARSPGKVQNAVDGPAEGE